jgi:excisionase family DNA binding protein
MKTEVVDDGLRTVAHAAERLGCSVGTIYNLGHDGRLELVKFGRNTRVTEASLKKLLETIKQQPLVQQRKSKEGA